MNSAEILAMLRLWPSADRRSNPLSLPVPEVLLGTGQAKAVPWCMGFFFCFHTRTSNSLVYREICKTTNACSDTNPWTKLKSEDKYIFACINILNINFLHSLKNSWHINSPLQPCYQRLFILIRKLILSEIKMKSWINYCLYLDQYFFCLFSPQCSGWQLDKRNCWRLWPDLKGQGMLKTCEQASVFSSIVIYYSKPSS